MALAFNSSVCASDGAAGEVWRPLAERRFALIPARLEKRRHVGQANYLSEAFNCAAKGSLQISGGLLSVHTQPPQQLPSI